MNTKLLRDIQQAIVEHAAHFNMNWWGETGATKADLIHAEPPDADCGTTACIAGFAVALSGGRINPGTADTRAARLLELSTGQAVRLFYADEWPRQFYARLRRAKRKTTRAQIAADRIDHFIATKGAE